MAGQFVLCLKHQGEEVETMRTLLRTGNNSMAIVDKADFTANVKNSCETCIRIDYLKKALDIFELMGATNDDYIDILLAEKVPRNPEEQTNATMIVISAFQQDNGIVISPIADHWKKQLIEWKNEAGKEEEA
jgi:hypothetical protein